MRSLLLALVVAGLAGVGPGRADAQTTTLTLLVKDRETNGPVSNALLSVAGLEGSADDFGQAELVGVGLGPLRVRASFVGYVPLDTTLIISEAPEAVAVLRLAPDVRDLGDVLVEAETVNDAALRRRGFFNRRQGRSGVFVTRSELDQRGANQFADVFRGMSGVRVQTTGAGTSLVSARRRGCLMAMYVDGTEMTYLSENIDVFPFESIAAVEVYRGPAEVPLEYTQTKSQRTCGAVLVWTRIVASDR